MASLRWQILEAIQAKLDAVAVALDWPTVALNPREPIGEDQMNALVLGMGGEPDPDGLTSRVDAHVMEISVGMVVRESASASAEELLDAGFVAVSDALLDPADIQLGGLAVDVRRGSMSPPFVGRGQDGARIVGVQEIGFFVTYWAREGDASAAGP